MQRIQVNSNYDTLMEINEALDDAEITFDFDGSNRYMISEEDTDVALEIIEDCGADADLV